MSDAIPSEHEREDDDDDEELLELLEELEPWLFSEQGLAAIRRYHGM